MDYISIRATNKEKNMTIQELMELTNNGNIFSVQFVKKDGTIRDMVCRRGVKKHLKGGELKFDAKGRGLLSVFDMQKEAYRFINTKTLIKAKINGVEYDIN
jgi:hypothetical protein